MNVSLHEKFQIYSIFHMGAGVGTMGVPGTGISILIHDHDILDCGLVAQEKVDFSKHGILYLICT